MSISYIVKESYSGFKRTPLATFTSIVALTISLILIGIIGRFYYSAYEIGATIRNDIEIEVFIQDVELQERQRIRTQLERLPIVESVTFISKDSAAAVFKELFGSEGSALAELDFLPASYRIQPVNDTPVDTLSIYLAQIEQIRGVDEVSFNLELLRVIDQRLESVLYTGGGIGLLILLTAMVLVFNTIRLTIYAKQSIIRAMKLVGATNRFIRSPFVMEGILQGIISAAIAVGFIWLFFSRILTYFIPQFGVLPWPFGEWYYLIGALIFLSIFMGFIGSRWAAAKFIRDHRIS